MEWLCIALTDAKRLRDSGAAKVIGALYEAGVGWASFTWTEAGSGAERALVTFVAVIGAAVAATVVIFLVSLATIPYRSLRDRIQALEDRSPLVQEDREDDPPLVKELKYFGRLARMILDQIPDEAGEQIAPNLATNIETWEATVEESLDEYHDVLIQFRSNPATTKLLEQFAHPAKRSFFHRMNMLAWATEILRHDPPRKSAVPPLERSGLGRTS